MSQISKGIFVAVAISLTLGVAQFAAGRDLGVVAQELAATSEATINRTAKADRVALATAPLIVTRTISVRLDGLSDTSVLIRVPVAKEVRTSPAAPSATTPSTSVRKSNVACEPVVSVLTEVAKLLQPGRCVT